MPDDKLPIKDFAAKIKAKYPEYANVNDTLLTQKILAKYPEYNDQVDMSGVDGIGKKKADSGIGGIVGESGSASQASLKEVNDFVQNIKSAQPKQPQEIKGGLTQASNFKNETDLGTPTDIATDTKARNHLNGLMLANNDDWKDPAKKIIQDANSVKSVDDLKTLNRAAQLTRSSLAGDGYDAKQLATSSFWAKDKNNITGQMIKARADDYDKVVSPLRNIQPAEWFSNATPDAIKKDYSDALKTAAIKAYANKSPAFKKELENAGLDINDPQLADHMGSSYKTGAIMDQYLNDPDVHSFLKKENPSLLPAFDYAQKNLLTDNKDYGINVVANKVSKAIQKTGFNSIDPLVNYYGDQHKEFANEIATNSGILTPQEIGIWNDHIKDHQEDYIDAPSLAEGFASSVKYFGNGVVNTFTQPFTPISKTTKDNWNKEASRVSADPEGFSKFMQDTGHALGTVASIASLGEVSGIANPQTASAAATSIGFFGDQLEQGKLKYSDSPVKAWASALFNTTLYAALSQDIFPTAKVKSAIAEVKPEMDQVMENLVSGKITREAAKQDAMTIAKKAVDFVGGTIGKTAKISAELTGLTIADRGFDKVMGLNKEDFDKFHPDNEAGDVAKSMFLSNLVIGGLGQYGEMKRENHLAENAVYEAANNPLATQRAIEAAKIKNPELDVEQMQSNLKFITDTKEKIKDEKLSPNAEKRYLFEALKEKVENDKLKASPEVNLQKRHKEEISRSQEVKERILNGEDPGEIVSEQDQKAADEKLSDEADRNKLVEKGHDAVQKLLDEKDKDDKNVFKGIYRDVAKSDPIGFLQEIADQAYGVERKDGERIKSKSVVPDIEENLVKQYGAAVVNAAKELFPIELKKESVNEENKNTEVPDETEATITDNGTVNQVEPTTSKRGILKKAKGIEDLNDPRDIVLQYFSGGDKIHPSALKELYGGKDERLHLNTKGSSGEQKAKLGLLRNDAPGIKELAHKLWEKSLDENGESKHTDQDFRNAIEDVLKEHNNPGSMAEELVDKYINKSVRQEVSKADQKHIDDVTIKQLSKHVEDLPEEHQAALINLLKDYQDQYGFVDWGKLEKDSNGFSPEILSLPEETQKALDGIIEKNIKSGQSEPHDVTRQDANSKKERGGEPPANDKEAVSGEDDSKTVGISHGSLKKVADRIGLEQPKRGTFLTPEEQMKRGRALLQGGVDPEKVAADFHEDGKASADEISVARAHFENLTKEAQSAMDKYGKNSGEFAKAKLEMQKWQDEVLKPMGTSAGSSFSALQGETDLDTGSFVSVSRAFKEETGNEPNAKQEQKIQELTSKNKELQKQSEDLEAKLIEATEQSLGDKKEQSTGIKEKAKKVADVIRKLKLSRPDTFSAATPASLVWDGAIEVVAKTVEAGGVITEAISKGIDHIKASDWYKQLSDDKKKAAEKDFTDSISKEDLKTKEEVFEEKKSAGSVKSKMGKPLNNEEKLNEDDKELEAIREKFADKPGNKFSIDEAKDIWNYAKKNYLDKGVEYRDMIKNVSNDLGLSWKQVSEAITSPKVKRMSDAMWKKQGEFKRQQTATKNWIDSHSQSPALKALRKVSSAFRGVSVFGHGGIFMGTHAGMTLFQPSTWKYTIPAFFRGWKFAYGNTGAYERRMEELKNSPNYITAQRAGLKSNPDNTNAEEYQKAQKVFGKLGLAGVRGFGAVKVLRQDLFDHEYNKLSDAAKADPNSAKQIAWLINNGTGATNLKLPEWVNEASFAGGMEAARWGKLTRNPAKATEVALKAIFNPSKATPAERIFAKVWARRVGEQLSTLASILLANAAIQKMVNPGNPVNLTNPDKSDFLKFKFGDMSIDPTSGMLGTGKFIYGVAKIPAMSKKDLRGDTPIKSLGKSVFSYGRGKLAPLYSTMADFFDKKDFNQNVMPFSDQKPSPSHHKLSWKEYAWEKAPLPVAHAADAMYKSATDGKDITTRNVVDAIISGFVSGGTGFRVGEEPKEKPTPFTEEDNNDPVFKYFLDKGMELPNTAPESESIKDQKSFTTKKLNEYPQDVQDKYADIHKKALKQELAKVKRAGSAWVNPDGNASLTNSPKAKRVKIDDLTKEQLADLLHVAQSNATKDAKKKIFHYR